MSDAEISTDEASDETNQAVNAWIGYAHSEGLVWDMPNSSETRAFLAGRASVRAPRTDTCKHEFGTEVTIRTCGQCGERLGDDDE